MAMRCRSHAIATPSPTRCKERIQMDSKTSAVEHSCPALLFRSSHFGVPRKRYDKASRCCKLDGCCILQA